MEIYLIRHTTPEIEKGICYGQLDIPLTSTFEAEAAEIIKKNPELKGEFTVYSSPLNRCKLLADKLFDATINFDERLKELNFGTWEGQKWDAIEKNELSTWMTDFVNKRCPQGESYMDLFKRVIAFKSSLSTIENQNVAIITHGGVIRAFLAHYYGVKLIDSFKFKIGIGDVIKCKM